MFNAYFAYFIQVTVVKNVVGSLTKKDFRGVWIQNKSMFEYSVVHATAHFVSSSYKTEIKRKEHGGSQKSMQTKKIISFVPLQALCLSASPFIVGSGDHPHLTFDLSHNVMHHQRAFDPKAGLAVRVAVAAGRGGGVCQGGDGVGGAPVPPDGGRVGRSHRWGALGRRRGVTLEERVECPLRAGGGALVFLVRVPAALVLGLVVQQGDQEVDVLDRQAQNFVLAELLVGRVRGDEFPQLGESPVHVLLAPALAAVGEDAAGDFLRRACRKI